MLVIDVTIKGVKPILLHNPASMGKGGSKDGVKRIPTPEAESDAGCYWSEDGKTLVFPGFNIYRSLVNASGNRRIGKKSVTPLVAGCVWVEPEFVPFGTKKYTIDTRRAIVQRQGIMRSRPKLEEWSLSFRLVADDQDFPVNRPELVSDLLKSILEEAGRRVGIGDFRPEKKGPYGRFIVTKWEAQATASAAA